MGARTTQTTSGGGAATPVANEFQSWLMSQLTGNGNAGGQFANQPEFYRDPSTGLMTHRQAAPVNSSGMQPSMGTAGGPLPSSFNQNGSPFTNAFNNMLNGQVIDPSGANAAIASGIGQGANQFGQNYQSPYQAQQFQSAALNQLPTQFGQGQTGMADLSQVNQTALSSFNPQQANSQFTGTLSGLLGQGQGMLGGQNAPGVSSSAINIGPGISLDPATVFDMDNPYFNALKTQQERAKQMALAENNARFGAQGAGAIGTGAQLANSNLQSAMSADQTVALQQALQGLQQQDLAERGTRANVGLTSRGQDAQVGIANAGNALQAALANQNAGLQQNGMNNALFGNLLNASLQGRGQDFSNQQAMNEMGLQQSLANAGFQNTRNSQDIQALLANQGLGNQFGLSAAGLNNDAMQMNNQNALSQANSQNQFNLTNSNQAAGFQNQTNQLNSQNYQQNQQNWQNLLGMGQQGNALANQNQLAALQQLFQSLGQSTGIGIQPQQTTVNQQGSPWAGLLGAVAPFAGQALGSWWGNRGNSGGMGTPQTMGGGIQWGGTTNNGPVSAIRYGGL